MHSAALKEQHLYHLQSICRLFFLFISITSYSFHLLKVEVTGSRRNQKVKQITRHVECFTARPGWILFLQMHQAILDSTTKVSLVPFQAGDGGRDPPWTFPPEGNHEVKGMDFL